MIRLLQRWFNPAPLEPTLVDPTLGILEWSDEHYGWLARLPDTNVTILICGGPRPDSRLLSHARDIAINFPVFETMVQAFLNAEASSLPAYFRQEVLSLELESINLFWPRRPNDGMLWFKGGSDYRLWRCDYVARNPVGLGFDS